MIEDSTLLLETSCFFVAVVVVVAVLIVFIRNDLILCDVQTSSLRVKIAITLI